MALHTPTPAAVYGDSEKQQMLSDLEVSFDLEKLATLLNELAYALNMTEPTEASSEEKASGNSYYLVRQHVNSKLLIRMANYMDMAVFELRERALRKV